MKSTRLCCPQGGANGSRGMRLLLTSGTLLVLTMALAPAAPAQGGARQAPPRGREIAEKARGMKLDNGNATTADFHGKKMKLTPADLSTVKSTQELEAGQVLGVLENEAPGDETNLPPGTYDIFLTKLGDQWHAYAESNGQIVAEAARAGVQQLDQAPANKKPHFEEKGWCTFWGWYWALARGQPWLCF